MNRPDPADRARWARLAVLCWLRGQITENSVKKYLIDDLGMSEAEATAAMCEP